MPVVIRMPSLSPTMESGKVVEWIKKEGEMVASGDIIVLIETDKAIMEFESVDEGKLTNILYPNDTPDVKVGATLAYLLEEGETVEDIKALEAKAAPQKVEKSPEKEAKKDTSNIKEEIVLPAKNERIFATPLARKIAQDKGVDLHSVQGTGPLGRIRREDVEAVLKGSAMTPNLLGEKSYTSIHQNLGDSELRGTVQPMSQMRKTIGQRLLESKTTIPHFYLEIDIVMDAANAARAAFKKKGIALTVHHMIMRATALALQECPQINVCKEGDNLRYLEHSDVAFALSLPEGLVTPIVFQAENLSLVQIAQSVRDLSKRGKEGTLQPKEFMGGSICVSNLGMYGVKSFSAIVNPPHAAILAIGALRAEPYIVNGNLAERSVMSCTISVDHRVSDGVAAAMFLQSLKDYLEAPILLSA
ncbi:MAG: dihydrolipoamide acetyltransferase family protein [Alphaproteobacteria bacterium]|nr:dihydrolipoamide acetyltransferase family protein [Alphaproteobacteria bacterium]